MSFNPTSPTSYSTVTSDLSVYGQACYTQGQADQQSADAGQIATLTSQLAAANATIAQLQAELNPPPVPVFSETWANLNAWGVYDSDGSYSAQGVRLASNVELVPATGTDPALCRIHVRPVTVTTTRGSHTLQPGDFAAGGMYPLTTNGAGKYGPGHKWVTTIRMSAPAAGTRGVFMLWGDDSGSVKWPASGEYDVAEDGALIPNRDSTKITYHAGPGNHGPVQVTKDLTQWVKVEVQWPADSSKLVVLFDGVQVDEVDATSLPIFTTGLASWRMQTALEGGGQSATYNGAPRQASHIDCGPLYVYTM